MKIWRLSRGDPLCLLLAADARFTHPDYANDHIWELSFGGGEPAALSLQTTFGLRARAMRLFPRFVYRDSVYQDPQHFRQPPCLTSFFPNYLAAAFSPFSGLDVSAEYYVPNSQVVAGRLQFSNQSVLTIHFLLEWVGLLNPLEDGESMHVERQDTLYYLCGRTSGLAPVCAVSGYPSPTSGPMQGLGAEMDLLPGGHRTLTWAAASLPEPTASLQLARQTLSTNWDAEIAHVELLNASQSLEIQTGNSDWDAALALSQKAARRAIFPGSPSLPRSSFVITRRPDDGYSLRGDGSDRPRSWSGQTVLDSYFLSSILLPGAIDQVEGLVENFLSVQDESGFIDCRPGLAGQRSRLLAQPMLAALTAQAFLHNENTHWLRSVLPGIKRFLDCWFDAGHDRDSDGFPEWSHPLQTGLEQAPIYDYYLSASSQGVHITNLESPALAAMLYRDLGSLVALAQATGDETLATDAVKRQKTLREALDKMWDSNSGSYYYRDVLAHVETRPATLVQVKGSGAYTSRRSFKSPQRLLVKLSFAQEMGTRPVTFVFYGEGPAGEVVEAISAGQFIWSGSHARTTTQNLFHNLRKVEVKGLGREDHGLITTIDYHQEDLSLLLPLWAGIPSQQQATVLIKKALSGRYLQPFGLPVSPEKTSSPAVHVPWNHLTGEGLLRYGFTGVAAHLVTSLMNAVIHSLKTTGGFYESYHATDGQGIGERNSILGLAPVGLFLQALGIQWIQRNKAIIHGINPFPWPVTVKYRGIEITRRVSETILKYPGGKTVSIQGAERREVLFP